MREQIIISQKFPTLELDEKSHRILDAIVKDFESTDDDQKIKNTLMHAFPNWKNHQEYVDFMVGVIRNDKELKEYREKVQPINQRIKEAIAQKLPYITTAEDVKNFMNHVKDIKNKEDLKKFLEVSKVVELSKWNEKVVDNILVYLQSAKIMDRQTFRLSKRFVKKWNLAISDPKNRLSLEETTDMPLVDLTNMFINLKYHEENSPDSIIDKSADTLLSPHYYLSKFNWDSFCSAFTLNKNFESHVRGGQKIKIFQTCPQRLHTTDNLMWSYGFGGDATICTPCVVNHLRPIHEKLICRGVLTGYNCDACCDMVKAGEVDMNFWTDDSGMYYVALLKKDGSRFEKVPSQKDPNLVGRAQSRRDQHAYMGANTEEEFTIQIGVDQAAIFKSFWYADFKTEIFVCNSQLQAWMTDFIPIPELIMIIYEYSETVIPIVSSTQKINNVIPSHTNHEGFTSFGKKDLQISPRLAETMSSAAATTLSPPPGGPKLDDPERIHPLMKTKKDKYVMIHIAVTHKSAFGQETKDLIIRGISHNPLKRKSE
jgi:hypothetical protein